MLIFDIVVFDKFNIFYNFIQFRICRLLTPATWKALIPSSHQSVVKAVHTVTLPFGVNTFMGV